MVKQWLKLNWQQIPQNNWLNNIFFYFEKIAHILPVFSTEICSIKIKKLILVIEIREESHD
jgi:hypothetical protein